jgi:hypothetical protein
MDPFELLKADHKKVAKLFDRLESASGKRKLDVFKQIKSELELHTHIEEKIFYPALEKPEETHDLTLEAYEEHKVVKTLLSELARAKSADDEWQAKAKVLRENVEHHVDEEEKELFKKADDALSDEEIEALGNRMEAEKARKQGRQAPKPAEKNAKSKKANTDNRGIISKIANFIGLGPDEAKKASTKVSAKKTVAHKGSKTVAKKASKKKSGKVAGKRSSVGAKAIGSRSVGLMKASGRKKAAKKGRK